MGNSELLIVDGKIVCEGCGGCCENIGYPPFLAGPRPLGMKLGEQFNRQSKEEMLSALESARYSRKETKRKEELKGFGRDLERW